MCLSSREYKVMLHAKEFAGDEAARGRAVARFWERLRAELQGVDIDTHGRLDVLKDSKQRDLFFLDTEKRDLYLRSDMVFRMRRKLGSSKDWKATLKFRHGDRLLAEAQDFELRKKGDEEPKFEEDVKAMPPADTPRFWALFSRSVEAEFNPKHMPLTVGECLAPYTDVRKASLPDPETPVQTVAGLRVVEHVYEEGWIRLSNEIEAECATILWWREEKLRTPIAAEFSFRFPLEKGGADIKVVRKAWTVMKTLLKSPLVDPKGPTKTALAYGDAEV
ncbi:hypothetical protein [Neorhizobium sp. T25_13]|uniref:hypothetical protein n=1 Tax=Neorhizobium sp. T25_13 TaxID=2093830 RepID=UPI000CF97995|nr:hypothetical protein [Neorhizobium sp. T25_13]